MPGRTRTITELKKELKIKQRRLSKLRLQRRKLAAGLVAIDKHIDSLAGETANRGRKPKRARRKKARKVARRKKVAGKTRKAKRPRKRATGTPLMTYLVKVLGQTKKGLRIKDIASAVAKAGYKSRSKDFYAIVATALRDKKFKRVSRGVYTLAG